MLCCSVYCVFVGIFFYIPVAVSDAASVFVRVSVSASPYMDADSIPSPLSQTLHLHTATECAAGDTQCYSWTYMLSLVEISPGN